MSLSNFTANLTSSFDWSASHANGADFLDTAYQDALRIAQALAFGSASNDANQIYIATRTVTLATLTDNLDLSGSLLNPFGETINFTSVKGIFIFNRSHRAGENLYIGASGSSAWITPFGASSTFKDTCYARGVWQRTAPLDGFAVVAGSADNLRIAHGGVAGDITYDIVIIGIG